jgi:hypothetical protein
VLAAVCRGDYVGIYLGSISSIMFCCNWALFERLIAAMTARCIYSNLKLR